MLRMLKNLCLLVATTLFLSVIFMSLKFVAASQKKTFWIVELKGYKFKVEIADTIFKKQLGLGGRKYLRDNEGMLFPFDPASNQAFWMKGMLISIDIIWIKNGRVVGVYENLSPPNKANNYKLSIFKSPGLVDSVLEVRAHNVSRLGIKTGDTVKIHK